MGSKTSGRRPRPVPLKVLDGERKDRLPSAPIEPPIGIDAPLPPEDMSETAVEMWNRLAPQMHGKQLLTEWDLEAFRVGCEAFARYVKASRLVDRSDVLIRGTRGTLIQNPAMRAARDNAELFLKVAREFGLTPAARAGIDLGETDHSDDLKRLLS